MPESLRQLSTALRALLVLTLLLGVVYPLLVTGIGALAFPDRSRGSLIVRDGTVVGSRLLGQSFEGDQWFLPRPSAGEYDGLASGGSNLGPNEPDLVTSIDELRADVAAREEVDPAQVPPDAVTASASGLDPDISPAYAELQVARVAAARGRPEAEVRALVAEHTAGRTLGFLGQPRVNVVELNVALG